MPLAIVLIAILFILSILLLAAIANGQRRRSALPMDDPQFQEFAGSLAASILVVTADLDRILYASPGFGLMFGSDPSEVTFGRIEGMIHGDDVEGVHAALGSGRDSPFESEFRILRDGETHWLHMRGFPVPGRRTANRIVLWIEDRSIRKSDELKLAEARDYEVTIGARIQQALLLGQPERAYSTFELASMTLPSQKIDGDFIDFYDGGDEVLDLMVGDVMGKGIPAALTGAAARNAFVRAHMTLADESNGSRLKLKDIVGAAEKRIAGKLLELKTFFTLIYGRIDGNAGLFRYVDCGHTSIVHYEKRSGRCWRLKGSNAPMGFLPAQEYVEYAVPVDEGDILFLYSDGITEATNSNGE
ncbi:MAG: PAS domain S-box protein, partial [Spirochaetales bacterium]